MPAQPRHHTPPPKNLPCSQGPNSTGDCWGFHCQCDNCVGATGILNRGTGLKAGGGVRSNKQLLPLKAGFASGGPFLVNQRTVP